MPIDEALKDIETVKKVKEKEVSKTRVITPGYFPKEPVIATYEKFHEINEFLFEQDGYFGVKSSDVKQKLDDFKPYSDFYECIWACTHMIESRVHVFNDHFKEFQIDPQVNSNVNTPNSIEKEITTNILPFFDGVKEASKNVDLTYKGKYPNLERKIERINDIFYDLNNKPSLIETISLGKFFKTAIEDIKNDFAHHCYGGLGYRQSLSGPKYLEELKRFEDFAKENDNIYYRVEYSKARMLCKNKIWFLIKHSGNLTYK